MKLCCVFMPDNRDSWPMKTALRDRGWTQWFEIVDNSRAEGWFVECNYAS